MTDKKIRVNSGKNAGTMGTFQLKWGGFLSWHESNGEHMSSPGRKAAWSIRREGALLYYNRRPLYAFLKTAWGICEFYDAPYRFVRESGKAVEAGGELETPERLLPLLPGSVRTGGRRVEDQAGVSWWNGRGRMTAGLPPSFRLCLPVRSRCAITTVLLPLPGIATTGMPALM